MCTPPQPCTAPALQDSITANLRVDFSGRGELAERQQRLGQLMQRLRKVGAGLWVALGHGALRGV